MPTLLCLGAANERDCAANHKGVYAVHVFEFRDWAFWSHLLEPFLAGADQPHLCEGLGQRMKGIFLFVKWRVSDLCHNLHFRFGGTHLC